MFPTAESIDEWIKLAKQSLVAAQRLRDLPATRNAAWSHAGFACECMLKAAILAKERLNTFPSRAARPDLYEHDLKKLAKVLGLEIDPTHVLAPQWRIVIGWRREHTYVAGEMPEAVVNDLIEAVFGREGMVPWLSQNYLRSVMGPDENIWTN